MSDNFGKCILCLQDSRLSKEHIIPESIGGILWDYLLCLECNNEMGHTIDSDLCKYAGPIATTLSVSNQPFEVEDAEKNIKFTYSQYGTKRKDPRVIIETDKKRLKFSDVTARSEKELGKIVNGINKKYIVDENFEIFQEHNSGYCDAYWELKFNDRSLLRSAAKIAFNFLAYKLGRQLVYDNTFNNIRQYIRFNQGEEQAAENYIDTTWLTDNVRPLHRIHIGYDKGNRLIVGYVMFFGIFRYTVLLAENYNFPIYLCDLDYTYDPVQETEIVTKNLWTARPLTIDQVLRPKQLVNFALDQVRRGFEIIKNYNNEFQFIDFESKTPE